MNKPIDPRERYLEIAALRFSEAGFHGVSLAALAKDAGVTKQALLHFFGTKERLYGEVLSGLSHRLCAEIDAAKGPPEERVIAYFAAHADGAFSRPEDARLVVRALLDSKQEARRWPLKAYLDKLIEMAQATPRWRDAPKREVLAGLYRLIGALQYFAISKTALSAMYGEIAEDELKTQLAEEFRLAVETFVGRRP